MPRREHPVLDYQSADDGVRADARVRPVHMLSLLASLQFLLPFPLLGLCWGAHGPGADWRGMWLLAPAGVLWLAGALTAVCGFVLGLRAIARSRPRCCSILAVAACGTIVLISLAHVLRGFRQTFQYGP